MAEANHTQAVKVTISLPADLLAWVDHQVAQGQTRSEAIRRALERVQRWEHERELRAARGPELDEQYARSYREHPQEEDLAPWPTEMVQAGTK